MRILVLGPHSYYIDRGSPIDLDILLRALSQRGDQVEAAVFAGGEDREYPNVSIHRIQVGTWLEEVGPGFSFKKLLCDARLFLLVRELVRERNFDIVHAVEDSVFIAMWIKFRHKIPYIYDMDSSLAQQLVETMPFLKPFSPFFGWCETKALGGSLAAAPVCNELAKLALRKGAPHVEPLYDISQLDPELLPQSGSLKENLGIEGTLALYVGNFETYQGIDLLLMGFQQAYDQAPDLHLVLAGGSDRHINKYRRMAGRLGISARSHFIGHWPFDRLGELLGQADILVVPRIRGVNTPMKVFPFLHSGKPVLATRLPTHTQVLDDRVAYLAEPTPKGFGDALVDLSTNSELRQTIGQAGRRFIEHNHVFSRHRARVDRLYDWVESVRARDDP